MLEVIPTGCPFDCGGSCSLRAHVEDGVLKRIEPDDLGEDTYERPQLRPCARGIAAVQRVYAPDRILYPLRRTGERGMGSFERITWDEALNEVAGQLKRVRDTYGPASILNLAGTGNTDGRLHHTGVAISRLLNMFGGHTHSSHIVSYQGATFASRQTFGTMAFENDRNDLLNSKLVIVWGCNPAETINATNANWYLARAKENGARFVFVDPFFSESAAALADQWIPIRPGTDTAMLLAMAYVMITEGLHDRDFLDRFAHGFAEFSDYCLGKDDGVKKTPLWAESLTGVPAEIIASLAREYATTSPARLHAGWAPGRTAFGEQYHRAAITLAAMTGNIGRPGGGAGVWLPDGLNPPPEMNVGFFSRGLNPIQSKFPAYQWADAVLRGKAGGYPSDIKMLYCVAANPLNQFADTSKGVAALKSVEFTVVHELFMTPMARYADVILPAQTHFERNDIQVPHDTGNYLVYSNKVIEPIGECKSDLEICSLLAERLGVVAFNDHTEDEWLPSFMEKVPMQDFDTFRSDGVWRFEPKQPRIAFAREIADPAAHRFPSPTGKIEILSTRLETAGDADDLPAIPKYMPPSEAERARSERYPLKLISAHSKKRANSSFDNLPWLRELEPESVWLNSADAASRNIRDGDLVRVFSDVGTVILPVKITERLMPGVVNIYQGAWYTPDPHGNDRGGCVNVLTRGDVSPAGAAVMNGVPIQVERIS